MTKTTTAAILAGLFLTAGVASAAGPGQRLWASNDGWYLSLEENARWVEYDADGSATGRIWTEVDYRRPNVFLRRGRSVGRLTPTEFLIGPTQDQLEVSAEGGWKDAARFVPNAQPVTYTLSLSCPTARRQEFTAFQQRDGDALVARLREFGIDAGFDFRPTFGGTVTYRTTRTLTLTYTRLREAEAARDFLRSNNVRADISEGTGEATLVTGTQPGTPAAPADGRSYWCPEWRTTATMDSDAAGPVVRRLRELGAEATTVGAGAGFDDPLFPTKADRNVKVRYRIEEPQPFPNGDPAALEAVRADIARYGFTVVRPGEKPAKPAARPAAEVGARSEWVGVISQESGQLSARLSLRRDGERLYGELSFSQRGRQYRAKVEGTLEGEKMSLTSTEALEGRVFIPVTYVGTLRGTTFAGAWTFAAQNLTDDFTFTLSK